MNKTTFSYTAECGCQIVQYGTVWHGDGFVPERTEILIHCRGEWISVEDRLPEKTGTYLIAYRSFMIPDTGVMKAYYTLGVGWELPASISCPLYWMPLPSPPDDAPLH